MRPVASLLQGRFRPVVLAVLVGLPLVPALVVPVVRYGDASDYVMMAFSLARDRDLRYDERDLARVLASRPPGTDYPAGMFLIRTGPNVLMMGAHSFLYPLVAVPFTLCGYRGFALLNALLLAGAVALAMRQWGWRRDSVVLVPAAFYLSAAFDYVIWPSAETWLLFLSTAFLVCCHEKRFVLAGLCLGLGVATQPPMGLWALVPLVQTLQRRVKGGQLALLLGSAAVAALPQFAYNVLVLRTPQPAWLGIHTPPRFLYYPLAFPTEARFSRPLHAVAYNRFSRLGFVDPADLFAAMFSPTMGLVWFYPFSLLAAVRLVRERRGGLPALASLAVLLAFCTAGQLATHQVGLRYLNAVYPALILGFTSFKGDRLERALVAVAVLMGLTFLLFPRANSQELISQKAVIASLFARRG